MWTVLALRTPSDIGDLRKRSCCGVRTQAGIEQRAATVCRHQILRPRLATAIPIPSITGSTVMFVQTPVVGNDALDIPLALVRGHRRHPAHLTKCPLAATSMNLSTESYNRSRQVIGVSHVRNAGNASVAVSKEGLLLRAGLRIHGSHAPKTINS